MEMSVSNYCALVTLKWNLLCVLFLQDLQAEVPSHLLHLKVDVERKWVAVILQDCRAELDREMQALAGTCTSERVIKEHKVSPNIWSKQIIYIYKEKTCFNIFFFALRPSSKSANLWLYVRKELETWKICAKSCLTTIRLIEHLTLQEWL